MHTVNVYIRISECLKLKTVVLWMERCYSWLLPDTQEGEEWRVDQVSALADLVTGQTLEGIVVEVSVCVCLHVHVHTCVCVLS